MTVLLPGLWVALLATGLGLALRRWFDPIPRRCWIAWGIALAVLLGPVLFGGRVLLAAGYLTKIPPFRQVWTGPGPPPGNLLQSDTVLQIAPWLIRVREAFASGEWPLWNHLSGAGEPLLGNPQTQAWQPLVWPSLLFPAAQGLGIVAAVRVLIALVFLYLLLRRQGISEAPALGGSLAYGLGAGLLLWLNWPMSNTAALLPLLFYGIVMVDQRGAGQDRALLALAVMAFLCAGHPETILHGAILASAFALSRLATGPSRGRSRTFGAWIVSGLVGLGLAAPALLTAAGYLPQSLRVSLLSAREGRIAAQDPLAQLRTSEARNESARAMTRRLIPVAAVNAFGNSRFGKYWGESNSNEDAAGFAGTAALLAALLAFAGPARRFPQERVMMAAAAVALVVLARPPGLDQLLNALPVLRSSLTFHHRILLTLVFCLTYLAACTWERWNEIPSARKIAVPVLLGALIAWAYLAHPSPDPGALEGLRRASLAVQLGVLVLASFFPRRGWLLAGVIGAELLFFHVPANPAVPAGLFYPETPPVAFVRQRLNPWLRMAGLGPALRANIPSVYGLADPRSSNPAKPAAYVEAVSRINLTPGRATDGFGEPLDPLYQLLGVRYLMTPPDSPLPGPWKLVLRDPAGWVWERPRSLPRIFLPHTALACPDGVPWSDCTKPIRNYRREAALRTAEPWSAANPRAAQLDLLAFRPAWLRARARLTERRLLASSVYQDGGWHVLRDGEPQPPILANGPFVAAWLPAGNAAGTDVDVIYRPKGFLTGMLLAALALATEALWVTPGPSGVPSAPPGLTPGLAEMNSGRISMFSRRVGDVIQKPRKAFQSARRELQSLKRASPGFPGVSRGIQESQSAVSGSHREAFGSLRDFPRREPQKIASRSSLGPGQDRLLPPAHGPKLFLHHPPESRLERLLLAPDVLPEGFVDQRLVVPATRTVDRHPEPV
jgi:hypothetical protein